MAADAPHLTELPPLLTAEDFSEEQWALLQRAFPDVSPTDAIKGAVLALAEQMIADAPGPVDEDGEPLPEIGATSPAGLQDEQEEAIPLPVAIGADAALLERVARLERQLAEVRVWAKTVLSELYAHTGFASEDQEQKAREKALAKLAAIEKSVAAELAKDNNATVN